MPKDLFASVPEFLAAFDNILVNGFFEKVGLNAGGSRMEGQIGNFIIIAEGCIPSSKKYKADGCGLVIDLRGIISSCRELAERRKVKDITTTVETMDWPLWDSKGENIVGSKGRRTQMLLCVTLKT